MWNLGSCMQLHVGLGWRGQNVGRESVHLEDREEDESITLR
jgi:hypothetical protein